MISRNACGEDGEWGNRRAEVEGAAEGAEESARVGRLALELEVPPPRAIGGWEDGDGAFESLAGTARAVLSCEEVAFLLELEKVERRRERSGGVRGWGCGFD